MARTLSFPKHPSSLGATTSRAAIKKTTRRATAKIGSQNPASGLSQSTSIGGTAAHFTAECVSAAAFLGGLAFTRARAQCARARVFLRVRLCVWRGTCMAEPRLRTCPRHAPRTGPSFTCIFPRLRTHPESDHHATTRSPHTPAKRVRDKKLDEA